MKPYFFLLAIALPIFPGAIRASGAAPGFSIANAQMVEGNAGLRMVEVIVIVSQVLTNPVTLSYATRNASATSGSDYVAANGSINFAPGENQKRITLSINGDLGVEANETFEIILNSGSGATLLDSIGTVTIVNDDFISGSPPVYEVRLTHTGYTSFAGSPDDCPIRANGKVVLTGLLSGAENVAADDDVRYTGVLDLSINMDICSSKPGGPMGDEYKVCGMTVIGQGTVETELEIYYDQRGGYVKIENQSGDFLRLVFGSCDQPQMDEEKDMVPNKTIATIFNGRDLPMLLDRTLRVGRWVEREGVHETVVEVLRKLN